MRCVAQMASFEFQHVFGARATQEEVYDGTTRSLINGNIPAIMLRFLVMNRIIMNNNPIMVMMNV
jgi:hypothetical protein